jgi:hypothetical protein
LNRDSALFIALWLVLDQLVRFYHEGQYELRSAPLDWRRMLAGAICIAIGLQTLELLKRNLLVQEVGPKRHPGAASLFVGIALVKDFADPIPSIVFVLSFNVLNDGNGVGACLVRRDPERYLALYLVELALMGSLFMFGVFSETRIYLVLIPFVVMPAVLLSRPKSIETTSS